MTLLTVGARRRRGLDGDGPLAEWRFTESAAPYYTVDGDLPLLDTGTATTTEAAPYMGNALVLGANQSLYIAAENVGRLNIGGAGGAQVTVAAWAQTALPSTQRFVAGIWQELGDGPARQYGTFASLPGLSMSARSCFHISKLGGASPGWNYSYDAAGNPTPAVTANTWQLYVGTYDGEYIRAYLNGVLTEDTSVFTYATSQRNPYYYPDGLNSNAGAFTVGAVSGQDPTTELHSFLTGKLARLRVWDRALTAAEVAQMYADETAP